MALIVTPEGELEVRAPLRLSHKQILAIVSEKSGWIEKQKECARKSSHATAHRKLSDGAHLWYLGKSYPLYLTGANNSRIIFSNGFHLPENALPRAGDLMPAWYKAQARVFITQRVEYYAHKYSLNVHAIRITSARTRWGSCSRLNSLSFTWRLIMAPVEIIDYIVLHELAHILEKNHSRAFWSNVARMQPDYKWRRAWLKANGRLLDLAIEANEANLKPVDH